MPGVDRNLEKSKVGRRSENVALTFTSPRPCLKPTNAEGPQIIKKMISYV